MSDSEGELVVESDLEEESLTRDVESLRETLESEAEPVVKQGRLSSTLIGKGWEVKPKARTEEGGSTLEQLKECLQKNQELQASLSRYLSEVEDALLQNRKKREKVETGGHDYMRTICTLHKMRRRRIYFVDNNGKSPYIRYVVNPPFLTRNYYFHDNRWWPNDDSTLRKHVSAQAIEVANRPYEEQLSRAQDTAEIESLKEKMREISDTHSKDPSDLLEDVDPDQIMWENIAYEGFKKRRTAADCHQRWVMCVCPSINNSPWTKEEEVVVMKEGKKQEGRDWRKIAAIVGNRRSPFNCFTIYQNAFNSSKRTLTTWSKACDVKLREAVEKFGAGNWLLVSRSVGRSVSSCRSRWEKSLSPSIRKGRWIPSEDKLLKEAVRKYSAESSSNCWKKISSMIPGRSGPQCRERWVNILNPDLTVGRFSAQENKKLLELCSEYERKGIPIAWAKVAQELPNRTDAKCCVQWQRLTTPEKIMKNYALSKMKEKIKPKVRGRKSQLALDFKDFDDDMIPEQLKTEAKSYGVTITRKRLRKSPKKTGVSSYLTQLAAAMQGSMHCWTLPTTAPSETGAQETPIMMMPCFPETSAAASGSDQAASGSSFPVGPRFITRIVSTSQSSRTTTTTGQVPSMEVLQSFCRMASSVTSVSSSTLSAAQSSSSSSALMSSGSSRSRLPVLMSPLPVSYSISRSRSSRPAGFASPSAVVSSSSVLISSLLAPPVSRPLQANNLSSPVSSVSTGIRPIVGERTPVRFAAARSSCRVIPSVTSSAPPISCSSISSRTRSVARRGTPVSSAVTSPSVPLPTSISSASLLPDLVNSYPLSRSSTSRRTRSVGRRCTPVSSSTVGSSSAAAPSVSRSSSAAVSSPSSAMLPVQESHLPPSRSATSKRARSVQCTASTSPTASVTVSSVASSSCATSSSVAMSSFSSILPAILPAGLPVLVSSLQISDASNESLSLSVPSRPLILTPSSRFSSIPSILPPASSATSQVPCRPSIQPSHAFYPPNTQSMSMSAVSTLARAANNSTAQFSSAPDAFKSSFVSIVAARLVKKLFVNQNRVKSGIPPTANAGHENPTEDCSSPSQSLEHCNGNVAEHQSSAPASKNSSRASTSGRKRRKQQYSPHKMEINETTENSEAATPLSKRMKRSAESSRSVSKCSSSRVITSDQKQRKQQHSRNTSVSEITENSEPATPANKKVKRSTASSLSKSASKDSSSQCTSSRQKRRKQQHSPSETEVSETTGNSEPVAPASKQIKRSTASSLSTSTSKESSQDATSILTRNLQHYPDKMEATDMTENSEVATPVSKGGKRSTEPRKKRRTPYSCTRHKRKVK